jgi:hypothetical protein
MVKTDSEKWCLRGPQTIQEKWRPSRKTYSGMKYLCKFIESKASKAGADSSDQSLDNIWKMFDVASKELITPGDHNQRIDQFKWRTMVSRIQEKLKAQQGGEG